MNKIQDRLQKLAEELSGGKYTVFAKNCGIPHSTFQNYMNGRMPHSDHLLRIHDKYGVDLNWLLTGKGDPYLSNEGTEDNNSAEQQTSPEQASRVIENKYTDVVRKLDDKSYAMDIAEDIAELERLNPEALKRVGSYIRGLLDGIRMTLPKHQQYAGPERRVSERRTKNISKISENGKDRRLGKDRRADVIR